MKDIIIQFTMINRFDWPDGEWLEEPDIKIFTDNNTGYDCAIRRMRHSGSLCGYVFLPENHPWCDKSFNEVFEFNLVVHGGVTYTGRFGSSSYCIGFDCAHDGDLFVRIENSGGVYRNIKYVEEQLNGLAQQLKEIEVKSNE